jgi:uncharacterized repeat protein (TIGR01451 family)
VLAVVGALLAPLVLGSAASAARAAVDGEPATPVLAVNALVVTGTGVTAVDAEPDPAYRTDLSYTVGQPTQPLTFALSYSCASETTADCTDSSLTIALGPVSLAPSGFTVDGADVTYRDTDDSATTDPTAATTAVVTFREPKRDGDGGDFTFGGTLTRPAGNGTQSGPVVVTPQTNGEENQRSRVMLTGEFPVTVATTTQLAWARTSYLSGVTTGGESPTNRATVTATLTADPASTLTVLWGGADPSVRPAAGSVGMLTAITDLAVTTWPTGAGTVTVTGWAWDGGSGAPQQLALATDATAATIGGLLAGQDTATLRSLTGLRFVFAAPTGQTIPSTQAAVLSVGVREWASASSTPQSRTGATVDYRTDVTTPPSDATSEINTLVVPGTVASLAARGSSTSTAVAATQSFRVYDPRPYAGSATTLAGLSAGTVYGGGYVKATAQATNWSRRAVDALGVTVRPTQADIDANDPVLNPDIADLDARVLPGAAGSGQQLVFAGFGTAVTGDAGDGAGLAFANGVAPAADLRLQIAVTAPGVTTTPVVVDLSSSLGVALPSGSAGLAAFGLTSWSQVTGFTATLAGAEGASPVPMGASVTVPYLVRAATSSTAATYTDHTLAFAELGTATSSVTPRSQASGNRPITSAAVTVSAPTVAVAGSKLVVVPSGATPAGRPATAVLSVQAKAGGSHMASTLTTQEVRTGTSDAWWNVYQPSAVVTGAPDGVTAVVQYHTTTNGDGTPAWQDYSGDLASLTGSASWLGFRIVFTRTDGADFAADFRIRSTVTFAVRSTLLNGATWTAQSTALTNRATFVGSRTVEGFTVSATTTGSDSVTAVDPESSSGTGRVSLVKTTTTSSREGAGGGVTANLTWGTDTLTDVGAVTVTDGNGLGDGLPDTGRASSYWDSFDLTSIGQITSGATAGSAAWDPYLVFDQVGDVLVYDATAGATGWHSLKDEMWNGTAWVPAAAGRTDVTFGASTTAAFPYKGAFPGVTITAASLQSRIGGVRLAYAPLSTADRTAAVAKLTADADWRTALVSRLRVDRVAATDGPARGIRLSLALRDTSRSTGVPVNDAHAYTGGTAGAVLNSGRVGATDGGGAPQDLGSPANPAAQATTTVTPATLGTRITKDWIRDSNTDYLGASGAELRQVALPVGYDSSTPPDAESWPTATLTVVATNDANSRVDRMVLSEPTGTQSAGWFTADSPFASFAITDVRELDDVSGVAGSTSAMVTVLRWDGAAVQESTATVGDLLGASEEQLADVVGLRVAYDGRVVPGADTRLVLSTRLLPVNRVSGQQPAPGLDVANTARVAVQDARVCDTESPAPIASADCATPKVVTASRSATLEVVAPSVTAYGSLALGQTGVDRDAANPVITSTMSVQNFGVSPADELLATDADPRYFNAVQVDTVQVPRFPSGVDTARLEVLVRQAGVLDLAVDGSALAYSPSDPAWVAWGTDQGPDGSWDLASLAASHGVTAADVIGVRVRFRDTDGSLIPAPGQSYGSAVLSGRLRETLLTGGLPSAVGADGWQYEGGPELTVNPGEAARGVVHNAVTAQAVRAGLTSSAVERYTEYLTVQAGVASLQVQKAELDPAPRKPGDDVRYRITVTNTAASTADLTGLVVTDRLPEDGSLVLGSATSGPAIEVQGADLGPWTQQVTDSTVSVTFGADARLAPGQSVQVLIRLRVADSLSTVTVVNSASASSASRPVEQNPSSTGGGTGCAAGGSYDADGAACVVSAGALVIGGANVYVSEKWVHDAGRAGALGAVRTPGGTAACTPRGGAADATWYRYPCAAVTEAGSTTQWQVQVTSRASVSTSTVEMVDMLPTAGDYSAMQGTGSRGSTWRPVWDGTVPTLVSASGTRVNAAIAVYTTTADYRAGGLAQRSAFDPVPTTWSATALTPGQVVPAAQAARVTGFKFVLTFPSNDTFSQGESVRVGWTLRTPVSGVTPETDAWNSFAFRVPADAAAGRLVDVTSVPLKAGVRYRVPAVAVPLTALGDRVWLDTDRDGIQDDGEPGVPGVAVDVLRGSGSSAVYVGSATTDEDGDWLVDGLTAGTYQVHVALTEEQKDQYRFTTRDQGGSDTLDSDATADADGLGGTVADVQVGAGQPDTVAVSSMPQAWRDAHPGLAATTVDVTRDAGLQWRPLAVGDRVWSDNDRDGVWSAGDTPVPGATVTLIGPGSAERSTTTLADGSYRFDSLDPGEYRIRVTVPAPLAGRWAFTFPLAGDDTALDSDVQSDGLSAPFTLTPGRSLVAASSVTGLAWAGTQADWADPTRDAGLLELPVSVGDRVWVDTDGDGVQGDGERGLAGVVLVLTHLDGSPVVDAAGVAVDPVTTDADGRYLFADLVPGEYRVAVDQDASADVLAPYEPTQAGAGDDRGADSDTGAATTAERVDGGSSDLTLDFGFRPLVALGDRVWLDLDRDGVQGADEAGLADVGVEVLGADPDAPVWSGTTDAQGGWLTSALPAGSYRVRFTLTPEQAARYRFTGTGAGAADVDSDPVADADGATATIAAATVDAGTPADGTVRVADLPAGWRAAHAGLGALYVNLSWDAGLQWRPVAVGDRIWFDQDRDGLQGADEPGVEHVAVALLDGDDAVLATTESDADGGYRFDGLNPGTYRVEFRLPDAVAARWGFTAAGAAPGDDSDAYPVAGSDAVARTVQLTLQPGLTEQAVALLPGTAAWAGVDADYADPTWDAGLLERSVSVGDRVWVDTDGDGTQDDREPGLPGVALVLTDADGDPVVDASGNPVGPVTTGADGDYVFGDLVPGTYTVAVDAAASEEALRPYTPTREHAGGDRAADSSTGSASTAQRVDGGTEDRTLDFGFQPLLALGDRVWLDADRDGVQDAGESSFAGADVRVLDEDGAVVATRTTGTDGRWAVDLLPAGDYTVEVELSATDAARYAWTLLRSAAAPRADADSDVADGGAPGLGRTGVITLGPETPGLRAAAVADGLVARYVDDTWDAGLVERPVSVGHRVWYDADLDGVQDDAEPGLPGVVLQLRTSDGRPVVRVDGTTVEPVTTDADGGYAFTGLLPGEYVVRVDRIASADALAGYAPTVAGAGADRALDSSTWTATSRALVGGESDTTLDFGLVLADDVQLALRKVPVARTADSITWDVTVMSTGTQDAYAGFTVVDALPGSLAFRSASGTGFACVAVDRVVSCDHDGSLPAGESATVRIVTGLTAAGADVTNTAAVSVEGRGYLFEVLAAEDVAWSEPVERTDGVTVTAPGGGLATTGSDAAWPLVAAGALLALGAALLAIASRRPVRRVRAAGSRHRA